MTTNAELYDQDFVAWTQTTAGLLRAGKWQDVDMEAIAGEIESLGKRDQRELESRLAVMLRHLLKWRYQTEQPTRRPNWQRTIQEQRRRLVRLFMQSPSLRPALTEVLPEEYAHAREQASYETHLPEATFPQACPWTAEQILDARYFPEGVEEHDSPAEKESDNGE